MFDVAWLTSAERELAAIWASARDREAVTEAAARIDEVLRANPLAVGESRSEGRRILFVGPLCVIYHPAGERRVLVSRVGRSRR